MTETTSNDRRNNPTVTRTRTAETNKTSRSRSKSPQPPMRRGMTVGGNPTTPTKGGTTFLGGLLDKGLFATLANPSLVGAGGVNSATAKPKNRSRATSPKRERPSPRGVTSVSPKPTERSSRSSRNKGHSKDDTHRDASPMRKRNPSGQPGGNGPALARANTLCTGTHHLKA